MRLKGAGGGQLLVVEGRGCEVCFPPVCVHGAACVPHPSLIPTHPPTAPAVAAKRRCRCVPRTPFLASGPALRSSPRPRKFALPITGSRLASAWGEATCVACSTFFSPRTWASVL
jgi:hypothetical protein